MELISSVWDDVLCVETALKGQEEQEDISELWTNLFVITVEVTAQNISSRHCTVINKGDIKWFWNADADDAQWLSGWLLGLLEAEVWPLVGSLFIL